MASIQADALYLGDTKISGSSEPYVEIGVGAVVTPFKAAKISTYDKVKVCIVRVPAEVGASRDMINAPIIFDINSKAQTIEAAFTSGGTDSIKFNGTDTFTPTTYTSKYYYFSVTAY